MFKVDKNYIDDTFKRTSSMHLGFILALSLWILVIFQSSDVQISRTSKNITHKLTPSSVLFIFFLCSRSHTLSTLLLMSCRLAHRLWRILLSFLYGSTVHLERKLFLVGTVSGCGMSCCCCLLGNSCVRFQIYTRAYTVFKITSDLFFGVNHQMLYFCERPFFPPSILQ